MKTIPMLRRMRLGKKTFIFYGSLNLYKFFYKSSHAEVQREERGVSEFLQIIMNLDQFDDFEKRDNKPLSTHFQFFNS